MEMPYVVPEEETFQPKFIRKNLAGQRFGRLVALRPVRIRPPTIHWVCRCDCGVEKPVAQGKLSGGHTGSCGCARNPNTQTPESFWAKVIPEPNTGCWLWMGCLSDTGYGSLNFEGRRWNCHRLAWVLTRGEVPQGLVLDHLCRVRSCVNPAHLDPVTQWTNALRGVLTKIDLETREAIQRLRESGRTVSSIAREYGIDPGYASRISRGMTRGMR